MSEQGAGRETGGLEIDGAVLAYDRLAGAGPTVVFLGGFGSDMTGTKAQYLAEWAAARGRAFLRFDYFGHGQSSGDFALGTITRWRGEVLAVLDALVEGPAVLVASSMGAWLACLAAMAAPDRIAGLVLIAPAADFTEALVRPQLTSEAKQALSEQGVWRREGGIPLHTALMEDGARWTILPGPLPITAPVRVLQGEADEAVPWRHALELFQAVRSEDAVFELIKDGDHRLSRPRDLARLVQAIEDLIAVSPSR